MSGAAVHLVTGLALTGIESLTDTGYDYVKTVLKRGLPPRLTHSPWASSIHQQLHPALQQRGAATSPVGPFMVTAISRARRGKAGSGTSLTSCVLRIAFGGLK